MKRKYLNKEWEWNEIDEKLFLVNDWTNDIKTVLPHIKADGLCIQAGGAMGIWPYVLSSHFKRVLTFEPCVENYKCLKKNLANIENIYSANLALGAKNTNVSIKLHPDESDNAGCYHTVEDKDGDIRQISIDSLDLDECDLIQLDIEGNELAALIGATETIRKFKPIIMAEDKALPHSNQIGHKVGEIDSYLESLNYSKIATIHRDKIFKHND